MMKRPRGSDTSSEALVPDGETDSLPSKKLKSNYSDDLITMLVGSAQEKFVIHKPALCKHSRFFDAACGREWKEGQEGVIRLPEANPEAFAVYAHWTYTETVDTSLMLEPQFLSKKISCSPSFINIGKLWTLGNFLTDHIFTNRVIDHLLEKLDLNPGVFLSTRSMRYIWAITPQGSDVQRVLLEMMAARLPGRFFEEKKHKYPPDLSFDLARRYLSGDVAAKSPTVADRCKYHTHEEGEGRCE